MTAIQIPISDEQHVRLKSMAEQAGLSVEEFLRQSVDHLIDQRDPKFIAAAKHVLQKNAELYRRLA